MTIDYVKKLSLEGKVAVVTGASGGIGQAICSALLFEGAKVVCWSRRIYLCKRYIKKLKVENSRILTVDVDVTNRSQVEQAVGITLDNYSKIDILVNNAGCGGVAAIQLVDDHLWDKVFDVNVKSVYLCTQAIIKHMIDHKGGKIINIASQAGKIGQPFNSIYSASKFAVIGLTQSLAAELGRYNITVNSICPGNVKTKMMETALSQFSRFLNISADEYKEKVISNTPLGRFATPNEIAGIAVFLASKAADYITGASILVTGGLVMV